jgi:hypothetical protein
MPSEQLTADDLLSLCARAHGATGRLTASPASPRLQTLRLLAGFVNDRMTAAALAHEREAVSIEVVHGLQDAVQALGFADLLAHRVDAGGYQARPRLPSRHRTHPGRTRSARRFLEEVTRLGRAVRGGGRVMHAHRQRLVRRWAALAAGRRPAVQMLADSCTTHLRHADGGQVPAEPGSAARHGLADASRTLGARLRCWNAARRP